MILLPIKAMKIQTRKGMTMIEMLVAIAVMLIAMQGMTYLFVTSWDTNKSVIETGLASATASRTVNQTIIQLRAIKQGDNGDYPIEEADDFDLTIYTDIDDDGVTERVHYYLDLAADEFKRGISDPNNTVPVTYPNGDTTTTTLAEFIVNENNDPVFSYYNDDYPSDTVNNPLATPASLGSVQLIKIKLRVNIDPVHAPENINIESFVDLRNMHGYE
jgi:prepilin-type N-terminal cleavage/methylation domain-containing protein